MHTSACSKVPKVYIFSIRSPIGRLEPADELWEHGLVRARDLASRLYPKETEGQHGTDWYVNYDDKRTKAMRTLAAELGIGSDCPLCGLGVRSMLSHRCRRSGFPCPWCGERQANLTAFRLNHCMSCPKAPRS